MSFGVGIVPSSSIVQLYRSWLSRQWSDTVNPNLRMEFFYDENCPWETRTGPATSPGNKYHGHEFLFSSNVHRLGLLWTPLNVEKSTINNFCDATCTKYSWEKSIGIFYTWNTIRFTLRFLPSSVARFWTKTDGNLEENFLKIFSSEGRIEIFLKSETKFTLSSVLFFILRGQGRNVNTGNNQRVVIIQRKTFRLRYWLPFRLYLTEKIRYRFLLICLTYLKRYPLPWNTYRLGCSNMVVAISPT